MQTEAPPELSDVGLQEMLLTVTTEETVMLLPVEVIDRAEPAPDAATGLLTLTGTVPDAVAESFTLTVASVPF